jgi:hypothetical protein
MEETWRQIKDNLPGVPKPDETIIHNSVKRLEDRWINTDFSYMDTHLSTPTPFEVGVSGVYNLGTQNGFSKYAFTSLESAVSNAIALYNKLEGKDQPILQGLTIV